MALNISYPQRVRSDPQSPVEAVELVLRMARENPSWGYDRIQGALANLGHLISDKSVGNILKAHGIDPAPDRKRQSTRKSFLQCHWDVLASIDFTTIEVWTKSGLVTIYLLFFMESATRRVHFAGSTTNPDEPWMFQIARNVSDAEDGFLREKKCLLMDRDTKFSKEFRGIIENVDEKATGNRWNQSDSEAYKQNSIGSVPANKIASVIETVVRRTPTKINSIKYFVKEITAQPDPRNRAWQKKRLEKIVHKIRDVSVGRSGYSMADFVEDVKCSCAREGIVFENDLFNELVS
jgi:hypothetical protein